MSEELLAARERLTWDRLRVLDALAEHGSVAAAAAALHVTAPAVSQQLRKLERECRTRLVEPDGRGIRLTAAGRMLAGLARTAAEAVQAAVRALAELDGEAIGPVRLGAVGSVIRGIVPEALTRLAERHPGLQPQLFDGEGVHMIPKLRTGELDLLVIESWSSRPLNLPARIGGEVISDEEVFVALPEAHPLAGRDEVPLAELAEDPWTACPAGTDAYEALVQAVRDAGAEPGVRHQLTDYTSQLALVAAGHAVSLVPELARRTAPAGIAFRPCRTRVTRRLVVAHVTDRATPAIRACIDACRESVTAQPARG